MTRETRDKNELAAAWFDVMTRMCDATPKGWHTVHGDALTLVSGAAIPSLNAAISTTPDSTAASGQALDEAASEVAGTGLPWSLIVRGAASDTAVALAVRYGLTEREDVLLMGCAAADVAPRSGPASGSLIRPVGAASAVSYADALAEGFEVPGDVFGSLMSGAVLDAPGFTCYLAEADGSPTATGMGVQGDGVIGVFNVSVVPSARSRGLGRAMTQRVMADGFAAGADTAYLNPSQQGLALYESMGFRVIETWTTFTVGESVSEIDH
jgi:ribosomal protein S18 acetylase RimI-like enzyme